MKRKEYVDVVFIKVGKSHLKSFPVSSLRVPRIGENVSFQHWKDNRTILGMVMNVTHFYTTSDAGETELYMIEVELS